MISILIPTGILLALYWGRFLLLKYRRGKAVSWLVPLAFTCLFIPKITLIQVNPDHSMAGIRTDDLLALVMLIIAVTDKRTWKDRRILAGIGFLGALTAAGIVSVLCGRGMGYDNAVLFSVMSMIRKFEYFAFALIGVYLALHTEDAGKTALAEFTWMFGFHIVIGLLQVAGLCNYAVIGFLDFWDVSWANRAISTFNGHYEYGHFLCFGIAVYLCVFLRTKKPGWLAAVAACFGMIWLTKSRTSLIVGMILTVLILLFSVRKTSGRGVKTAAFGAIGVFLLAGILFATGTLDPGRFGAINLAEYSETMRTCAAQGDLREYAKMVRAGISESTMRPEGISDADAFARFFKWGAALDGFRQSPFFGYGTGVTEVMDGNYIKMLGENGIVGLALWLGMFGYYMRTVWSARRTVAIARSVFWMMVSVVLASVVIDMFEASKPMEMLWLAVGIVIGIEAGDPPRGTVTAGAGRHRRQSPLATRR